MGKEAPKQTAPESRRNSVMLGPRDRLVGQLFIEGDLHVETAPKAPQPVEASEPVAEMVAEPIATLAAAPAAVKAADGHPKASVPKAKVKGKDKKKR
jgi:hypothetical protein